MWGWCPVLAVPPCRDPGPATAVPDGAHWLGLGGEVTGSSGACVLLLEFVNLVSFESSFLLGED